MANYPTILHTEECMREGMQIESKDISVEDKIRLIDALSETGLKEIAVGSFASPKWTPQMASIDDVIRGFHPKPGIRYTYSAFNERGFERARAFTPPLSERIRQFNLSVTMCDVFAQRNFNRTQAQEIARWPQQIAKAREHGMSECGIQLATAFGSNWTGEFSLEQRMHMLDRMYRLWSDAGMTVRRIGLSDAMSWGMPHTVEQQIAAIKERWPSVNDFSLHLHNGRGVALASLYAALRLLGPTDTLHVDTSIGGMAGCPYCGNGRAASMIATEDLMHMLEGMGIETGVDLYKLVEVVWLAEAIVGHPLHGFVSKCGPRPRGDRLYAMDMPCIETLDQARHFILGAKAYAGAPAPWRAPIKSWQRPESADPSVGADPQSAGDGVLPRNVAATR